MNNRSDLVDTEVDSRCFDSCRFGEIIDQLSAIKHQLSQISALTEQKFVTLGNILQQAHEQGVVVTEKAAGIIALTEGETGKKILGDTKRLIHASLNNLKTSHDIIGSRSLAVQTVIEHLQRLKTKNSDIEHVAKYLRAVALNIFIETARSRVVSDNFSIIATEIKELSETILAHGKSMRENVAESEKQFLSINHDIQKGMGQLEHVTGDAGLSVTDAVKQTDEWVDQAGKTAFQTAESHKTMMDQVGKIVMSLQFHDSMRQRLEHIETGIEDMITMCHGPDQENTTTSGGNFALLHTLAGFLFDQLGEIIQEIYTNHESCSKAFDSMGQLMVQVEQDVSRLTGSDKTKGSDITSRLKGSLFDFIALQNRGGDLFKRMDEAFVVASNTSDSLSEQVAKIHQISMDAHIKALNAIIAATHLGHEGNTLSVLAGEMKSLSNLTDAFVGDVGEIIRDLVSGFSPTDQSNDTWGENLALDEAVHAIPRMIDQMKLDAGELQDQMKRIHETHDAAKHELAFMMQMVEDLVKEQEKLDQLKTIFAPFWEKGADTTYIHAQLEKRHTMEKERLVHKRSITGFSESADNKKQSDDDEGLGDNIELF